MAGQLLFALAGAIMLFAAGLLVTGLRALLGRQQTQRRVQALEQPLELVVSQRTEVAGQLLCLHLAPADGGRLPPFVAGQHVLLRGPGGDGGGFIQRAYSLAAWERQPRHYELGIKREPHGKLSNWAWVDLQAGSRVQVLPPRGEFTAASGRHEVVLVGGGIGITPLRAMLHTLLEQQRPVVLHHAARHREALLYAEEFTALAASSRRFRYLPTLSRPAADLAGGSGRLDAGRLLAACADPAAAEFFLCAGKAMMDELRAGLSALGVAPQRIHHEAFGVGSVAGGQWRVAVGDRAFVSAGQPTLLAALEDNQLAPPSECRAGTCGLCRMRLASGEVTWLLDTDLALATDEILPCVCAAASDLRLGAVDGPAAERAGSN